MRAPLYPGHMADVVYDSVGKDTFIESLDCLRPRGLMVSFGNASGPPPRWRRWNWRGAARCS